MPEGTTHDDEPVGVDEPPPPGEARGNGGTDNGHDRQPYEFDEAQLATAVSIMDRVFASDLGGHRAARTVAEAAEEAGLDDDNPLVRELTWIACYRLQVERQGRVGCELGPVGSGGNAWPPPVRTVDEPVVELWRRAAGAVSTPAAIARLEDLLFCRGDGNGLARARRAVEGYREVADLEDPGLRTVEALLRSWTLARSVRDHELEAQVSGDLAHAADRVLSETPGQHPGVVLPLLAALAQGPSVDGVGGPGAPRVDGLLERAAEAFDRTGYLASEVAGYRRARAADDDSLESIARAEVHAYLRQADGAPTGGVRMHHLQQAAQVARDRGLRGLERQAVAEMQRIKPSEIGFRQFTATSSMPRYIPEGYLRKYTRSADWRDGLRFFMAWPDPPSGDLERLRDHERDMRGSLGRLFSTTAYGSHGLPSATTRGDQEKAAHDMAFAARVTAENHGRLMATGLHRLADHYGVPPEDDLVTFFTDMGWTDAPPARSLAKAFRHFWARDYESAVHVIVPKVETAARSLLLELDEGVYRVQVGKDPGGYPGLYGLLQELERLALDESWAYFLRWLLLGPPGANLRNDVAHGFAFEVPSNYAALCLRAAAMLISIAGPPTPEAAVPARDGHGDRSARDLESLLGLLASPTPAGGWLDGLGAWGARQLERGWWAIQLARARARQRRQRRPPHG